MRQHLTPSDHSLRSWSTDIVPAAQRMDYWVGAVCEGFLEMAVTSPDAAKFSSSLTTASLGPLSSSLVRGSAADVVRTRQAIARSDENYFYLLCKQEGTWNVAQGGNRAALLAGDLAIVDSRQPYQFHFPICANVLSIQMPISWMESWIAEPTKQVAQSISAASGWGRALSAFVQELAPEHAGASTLPHSLITDQLGGLLGLALGTPLHNAPIDSALHARIHNTIAERYAEHGLTVAGVAAQLHISERTLHRALSNRSETFANLLIGARMKAAQRMLGNPRFAKLSISEIGRRAGFSDSSHFARQCRRSLGFTPNALRQQHVEVSRNELRK